MDYEEEIFRYSCWSTIIHIDHEPREWLWASSVLRLGSIFVDVGAYIGGYSVRACKLGARVIAIEPGLNSYNILVRNLKLNSCSEAETFEIAAGEKEDIKPLFNRPVHIKPLDRTIPQLVGNSQIDLIKIDVDGYELNVLLGAKTVLKGTKYLFIELRKKTIVEAVSILVNLGFRILNKICWINRYGDVVCNVF